MMVIGAIVSIIIGVICGHFIFSPETVILFRQMAKPVLYILMFSVGISVGLNKTVFRKIKELHFKILIIPFGIIIGSLIGGIISALILNMNINEGLAIASGLGWYSLSGVMMTDLAGAEIGTITFMSNLFRELLSFIIIPFIAKFTNEYTVIAPAASTSEDTCLPIIRKYAGDEIIILSVINGVICSAVVPILVNLCYNLNF